MVEVHHDPDHALSDGAQSLYPEQFEELVRQIRTIAEVRRAAGVAPRRARDRPPRRGPSPPGPVNSGVCRARHRILAAEVRAR